MEIYTQDLVTLAQEYGEQLSKKIGYEGYEIEDAFCEFQSNIRKILYDRLSGGFNGIIGKVNNVETAELLNKELFKLINEF